MTKTDSFSCHVEKRLGSFALKGTFMGLSVNGGIWSMEGPAGSWVWGGVWGQGIYVSCLPHCWGVALFLYQRPQLLWGNLSIQFCVWALIPSPLFVFSDLGQVAILFFCWSPGTIPMSSNFSETLHMSLWKVVLIKLSAIFPV